MIEYKLKPVEIVTDDINKIEIPSVEKRIIVKSGDVVEFTMEQLDENIKLLERYEIEMTAKLENSEAKLGNIEHFHKWINKMEEDKIFTCWLYWESKKVVNELKPKLDEVKNQISLDKAEREEIIKQIPNTYEQGSEN